MKIQSTKWRMTTENPVHGRRCTEFTCRQRDPTDIRVQTAVNRSYYGIIRVWTLSLWWIYGTRSTAFLIRWVHDLSTVSTTDLLMGHFSISAHRKTIKTSAFATSRRNLLHNWRSCLENRLIKQSFNPVSLHLKTRHVIFSPRHTCVQIYFIGIKSTRGRHAMIR